MNKIIIFIYILFSLFLTTAYSQVVPKLEQFGNLQGITFMPNVGQYSHTDGTSADDVLYVADIPEGQLYVKATGISIVILKPVENKTEISKSEILVNTEKTPKHIDYEVCRTDMNFAGCNPFPTIIRDEPSASYTNFYKGSKSYTYVRSYKKLVLENVYPDIDFTIYTGDSNKLEYDFVVRQGGNPDRIALSFVNQDNISITASNSLMISNRLGNIEHCQPLTYQQSGSTTNQVFSRFKIDLDNNVRFKVTDYDQSKPLIIDPVIRVWTLQSIRGIAEVIPSSVKFDKNNDIVLSGSTNCRDFVMSTGQIFHGGGQFDGYLMKYNRQGKMIWSTYFGSSGDDYFNAMCLDKDEKILAVGWTGSKDLPLHGFQTKLKGTANCLFAKFDNNGIFILGTYIGGAVQELDLSPDCINDFAIAKDGSLYMTGCAISKDFYNTFDTYKPRRDDAFVLKLDQNYNLAWSRIFGGSGRDAASTIALDSVGNVYVAGRTNSLDFMKSNKPPADTMDYKIFLARFDTLGNHIWSRVLSSNWVDKCYAIEVDHENNVIMGGYSAFRDFELTKHHSTTGVDAFLASIDSLSRTNWCKVLGDGSMGTEIRDIYIDRFNNKFLTGKFCKQIIDSILPLEKVDFWQNIGLVKIDKDTNFLWYTVVGNYFYTNYGYGISLNDFGEIVISGNTSGDSFPITMGTFKKVGETSSVLLFWSHNIYIVGELKPFCIGQLQTIQYVINKKRSSPITFRAELSDTTGSFSKPMILGENISDTSGVISFIVPDLIKPGKKYKVRITTSDSSLSVEYGANISISYPPKPKIRSDKNSVCIGTTIILKADLAEDCLNTWTYGKSKFVSQDSNQVILTMDSLGEQKIILTAWNKKSGCVVSDTTTIQVNPIPALTVKSGTFCTADTVKLKLVQPEGGTYSGEGVIDNVFYAGVVGKGKFKLKYIYTNPQGCCDSTTTEVTVMESPEKPFITKSGNDLVSSEGFNYQWYKDGEKIEGEMSKTLTNIKTGRYSVKTINLNGCESVFSDPYDFINGIEDQTNSNIDLYPQPVEDILYISNYYVKTDKITISNLLGENVLIVEVINELPLQINVSDLSPGVYYVKIGDVIRKFVKI